MSLSPGMLTDYKAVLSGTCESGELDAEESVTRASPPFGGGPEVRSARLPRTDWPSHAELLRIAPSASTAARLRNTCPQSMVIIGSPRSPPLLDIGSRP